MSLYEMTTYFVLATLAGSAAWAAGETNPSAPRPLIREVETGHLRD